MAASPAEELRGLGYEYKDGKLVQIGTTKGFEFRDQSHYDKLADAVLRYVGSLLVDEAALIPLSLPFDTESGPHCQIFTSKGFENAQKLLLMIQGSGRVRVGVWGCALCINKDLDHGTMLPYILVAAANGYGVIVLNPNENSENGRPIPGSETPEDHVSYVYRELVVPRCRGAKEGGTIDVVAHSNGGRALLAFLCNGGAAAEHATSHIKHVVFTDSYHSKDQVDNLPPLARELLADSKRAVNYVPHDAPIGTPVKEWKTLQYIMRDEDKGCACLSSQAPDHASTNHASLRAAFEFLVS